MRERRPARLARRLRGAGLTLIELVVVLCVVAVLAVVVLNRLRFYQEAAEKAAMEYSVGTMKSALQLRAAVLLTRGEARKIETLAGANPIESLSEPPPGYRGEFQAQLPTVPPGSWYFDAGGKQLVYVPRLDDHLERLADGSKRLRFRVRLDFEPPEPGSKVRVFAGVSMETVTPYRWF